MQFDTTLSLDIIVAVLGIAGVFWGLRNELDKKFSELRNELKNDNANLRQELKADIGSLRQELKADNVILRQELKGDNASLRQDLNDLDDKVDAINQRLARLEGVILSREGLVDAIVETNPPE